MKRQLKILGTMIVMILAAAAMLAILYGGVVGATHLAYTLVGVPPTLVFGLLLGIQALIVFYTMAANAVKDKE